MTSDHESVFNALIPYAGSKGIVLTLTPPYQHAQRIERYVRTINDRMRAVLSGLDYILPKKLYNELLIAVIQAINATPNKIRPSQTPNIIFGAHKIDTKVDLHAPFGTTCMFHHVGKDKEDKRAPRAELGIILGPSPSGRGSVRAYLIHSRKVAIRHVYDVIKGAPVDLGFHSQGNVPSSIPDFIQMRYDGSNPSISRIPEDTSINGNRHSAFRKLIRQKGSHLIPPVPIPATKPNSCPHKMLSFNEIYSDNDGQSDSDEDISIVKNPSKQQPTVTCQSNKPFISEGKYKELTSASSNKITSESKRIALTSASKKELTSESNSKITSASKKELTSESKKEITSESNNKITSASKTINSLKAIKQVKFLNHDDTITTNKFLYDNTIGNLNRPEYNSNEYNMDPYWDNPEDTIQNIFDEYQNKDQSNQVDIKMLVSRKEKRYQQKQMTKIHKAYVTTMSVKKALAGEKVHETKQAVRDEIKNMLDYSIGYFQKIDEIPPKYRNNILRTFMFITNKFYPNGLFEKVKARLVVNGKQQRLNSHEWISSSTVNTAAVFLLMNIASKYQCRMTSYDIKGAFLNAKFQDGIDEPTYIRIDKDTADIWCTMDPEALHYRQSDGTLIMLLDKSLYGLKQAPLVSYYHIEHHLLENG